MVHAGRDCNCTGKTSYCNGAEVIDSVTCAERTKEVVTPAVNSSIGHDRAGVVVASSDCRCTRDPSDRRWSRHAAAGATSTDLAKCILTPAANCTTRNDRTCVVRASSKSRRASKARDVHGAVGVSGRAITELARCVETRAGGAAASDQGAGMVPTGRDGGGDRSQRCCDDARASKKRCNGRRGRSCRISHGHYAINVRIRSRIGALAMRHIRSGKRENARQRRSERSVCCVVHITGRCRGQDVVRGEGDCRDCIVGRDRHICSYNRSTSGLGRGSE